MSRVDPLRISLHEDPDLFRAAVSFTAKTTTFAERLIEKDYFCTVLLDYLIGAEPELVFKGGTCLAKVHAELYRLSEDLDFVIPLPVDAPRSQRSRQMTRLNVALQAIPAELPVFRLSQPLRGANNSRQYMAAVGYTSLLGDDGVIKIEIGLREPLLASPYTGRAQTLLIDPVSGEPLIHPVPLRCISRLEAFAEKFRAALSRHEVAIRDFYDIDYAVRHLGLRPADADLTELVRRKLAVPGNTIVDVSQERLAALRAQMDPQLKSVLRPKDFAEFELDRAFQHVVDMAARIG